MKEKAESGHINKKKDKDTNSFLTGPNMLYFVLALFGGGAMLWVVGLIVAAYRRNSTYQDLQPIPQTQDEETPNQLNNNANNNRMIV